MEKWMRAIELDDDEQLRACIQSGIGLNASRGDGWTALHHSVRLGSRKCFEYLIRQPLVDLNALNITRKSPLMLAIVRRSSVMVRALVLAGCSREFQAKDNIRHSFSPEIGTLLNPFAFSVVWSPELHIRFPYEEQQIAKTAVYLNRSASRKKYKGTWIYLPQDVLRHVIQYAVWLF